MLLNLFWREGALRTTLTLALGLALVAPFASAAEEVGTVAPADTAERALQQALELERQARWEGAIRVYEESAKRWPGRAEFRHRLRLCELHYKLGRRYEDPSFRTILLPMNRSQSLELYDELLDRILANYVEPVGVEPLLRRGYDNLEVALRDRRFLATHKVDDRADRVKWLRSAFQAQRDRLSASNSADAKAWISAACDLAQQALELPPSAVVLEFVFGACDALDDYSGYLTPSRLDDLYAMIDGNFVGIGVELKNSPDGLRVVGVIPGGPAATAGIVAGDQIVGVDTRSLKGLGLDEAANLLQGEEGSSVTVIVRKASGEENRLRLSRRPVEVDSISKSVFLPGGVGYLHLSSFQKTSTEEVVASIKKLQEKGMRYLVLDLRGNPGGLLNVAVELADEFLEKGLIVSTRGRASGQSSEYQAQPGATWSGPMAVLIDRDSASASEILAGALKEQRRALVLGERSYGKGSVQSIFPLRVAQTGLKLTTAKFYSPLNRPYSEQGVAPDVQVRSATKPPEGDSAGDGVEGAGWGDPELDPVLRMAVRYANAQQGAGR